MASNRRAQTVGIWCGPVAGVLIIVGACVIAFGWAGVFALYTPFAVFFAWLVSVTHCTLANLKAGAPAVVR